MSTWVDFKKIRESIDFGAVLQHYGVKLRIRRGNQHQGFCPLPTHRQHEGKKRSPSFSANLERKCFHCFSCQACGNCIDFVAICEGLNPEHPGDIRKAALLMQERFLASKPKIDAKVKPAGSPARRPAKADNGAEGELELPKVINAPLDFELKGLDPHHPYLSGRGFTPETIAQFGLGYCGKGLMANRIAIPLHDQQGKLIGYAGRLADDAAIDADHPKYLLPGTREREGKRYQFEKSRFVYGGSRLRKPVNDLIVVEGFASTWWLWQHGFTNAVALMGGDCSEDQAAIIVNLVTADGTAWVVTDGDDAGKQCAARTLSLVAQHRCVRWVKLAERSQPTDLSADALSALLPR